MTESKWQSTLIKRYEREGWYVIKLIQANRSGLPDLLLLKPSEVKFVEVKAATGKTSKVQDYRIAELRSLGFNVEICKAPA